MEEYPVGTVLTWRDPESLLFVSACFASKRIVFGTNYKINVVEEWYWLTSAIEDNNMSVFSGVASSLEECKKYFPDHCKLEVDNR